MALYDVIDDIAKKDILKTDTGDNRIFGVVIGEVVNNYNENFPGRVCITIANRDDKANELKWARVAQSYSGSKWGHYFLPEVGDQVLVAFEQGNIEKPFVIGAFPKAKDSFLSKSKDEHNSNKCIVTKNGSTLTFYDDKDGPDKDKIFIRTANNLHVVEIDNEHKTIEIKDKEKKAQILMQTEKGIITVNADEKIILKSGDANITINGKKNSISIQAGKIDVKASNRLALSSDGNTTLKGQSVSAEGTGGPTTVKSGSAIKIDAPTVSM